MKKVVVILLGLFAANIVFAGLWSGHKEGNFTSISTPAGAGYLWCQIQPTSSLAQQNQTNANTKTNANANANNLNLFSAFIATHCVNVAGMNCQKNSAQTGTLSTNLAWLNTHYMQYQKSGTENGDSFSNCGEQGVVQVRVDYDYDVQCQVSSQPPAGLQTATGPVC